MHTEDTDKNGSLACTEGFPRYVYPFQNTNVLAFNCAWLIRCRILTFTHRALNPGVTGHYKIVHVIHKGI